MAKPTIGLALGGGSARGWAHIGVVKTLIAAGLEPDIVAGTSIGAVAGACYVTDNLDRLEEFARSLTRRRIFGFLDFNFAGSGLITGQRLSGQLENHLKGKMIEDLVPRFVAIATELGTGHEVWLKKGDLVTALNASFALPGIFKPVEVNGQWMIDGALVNPIPVSVCRALGARIVIAVNLSSDPFGKAGIIHDHGALAEPSNADEAMLPEGQDQSQDGGALRLLAPPAFRARQGCPWYFRGDDGRNQHHSGPHCALAARRGPAGHYDWAQDRPHRLVRLPSRRRGHHTRGEGSRVSAG